MDQLEFQNILRKYLRGEASEEEERMIDRWYDRMGEEDVISLNDREDSESGKRYWTRIRGRIKARYSHRFMSPRWYAAGLAAAALLFVIFNLDLSYTASDLKNTGTAPRAQVVYKKIVNRGDKAQRISLPDGSKITLAPQSRVQYASAFDGPERSLYLDGKAFFEVVHDASRPFKVYTQKVITRVLGTTFLVTAYNRENEVTVSVKRGKVSVYTKEEAKDSVGTAGIILTPNQEFVFSKDKNRGLRSIVPEPEFLLPAEEVKRMRFEDASPKVIFEAIEKVYGVDIVFDENKFSSCRITTSISDGNLFSRLHIICEVMNASYRLDGDKIVIEGAGCQSSVF